MKKNINAIKNAPSWKSLLILYSIFIFIFIIANSAISNNEKITIDDLVDQNNQLETDLNKADRLNEYLSDRVDEQNEFINNENQKPLINLNLCNENLGLYKAYEFVVQYSFPNGPEKFDIKFTDSTGDLDINLKPRMELDEGVGYKLKGEVVINAYAEGLQGEEMLNIEIHAEDFEGQKTTFKCNNNLFNMNISGEGDFVRDHIRSPMVEDGYITMNKTPSGLVWEQHFDSPEECFVDEWILDWHVSNWNEHSKEEGEGELTSEVLCLSNVGTYESNPTFMNSFRYPILNIENVNVWVELYEDTIDDAFIYEACFEEINTEFEEYARLTTLNFYDELGWGDHWASGLTGDYRLVGIDISDNAWDHPTYASLYSVFSYGVSQQSSFEDHGIYIGHHNALPDYGFYLYEYGMVPEERMNYVSVIFQVHTYTGGNHGDYFYKTFNYDLSTCRKIELKDMMSDKLLKEQGLEQDGYDPLWLELLDNRLEDILRVDEGKIPTPDDDTTQPWSYANLNAVSINNDGLTFTFDPYVVRGWAHGWPEISISWANLWDIFIWGDWENREKEELFPNTIINDAYKNDITYVAEKLLYQFELNDLIIGSTHTYDPGGYNRDAGYVNRNVFKQDSPVVYGFDGNFTDKDERIVKEFTRVVNEIIGYDFFSYSTNPDQITIPIELRECLSRRPYGDFWGTGSCSGYTGFYNMIDKSIWIDSDLYGIKRDHVLIHELGHSLGLHHSSCVRSTIMSNQNLTQNNIVSFSDFEIALIRFLYSPLELIVDTENDIGVISDKTTFQELANKALSSIALPDEKTIKFCPDEISTRFVEEEK